MKNQGGETKAAPRPGSASKLVLEDGDSPEAAAPLEGGGSLGREGDSGAWRAAGASSVGGWATVCSSCGLLERSCDFWGRKSRFLRVYGSEAVTTS